MIDIDQDPGVVHVNQVRWMLFKNGARTMISVALKRLIQTPRRNSYQVPALAWIGWPPSSHDRRSVHQQSH